MGRFDGAGFNSLQETARKINEGSKNFNTEESVKAWLDKMGVENYTINDDLTVDVNGDVNLSKKGLTEIPVKFGIVKGDFDCNYNKLVFLKNSPRKCVAFHCSNNQLKSLEGAPEKCRYFYCKKNQITSLEGAPQKCDYFYCHNNKLVSLKGAPKKCRYFYCSNNKLTSLEGAPEECIEFYCSDNQITSLEGAPKKCDVFWCDGNPGRFTKKGVLKVCKARKIVV